MLQEILDRYDALDPKARAEIDKESDAAVEGLKFVPNPGPQHEAMLSEADELFYGGQVGGGKSFLIAGLAVNVHQHTLMLRRISKHLKPLKKKVEKILGTRDGLNEQDNFWTLPGGRDIKFGHCEHEKNKDDYQGHDFDLLCFDEIAQFLESQYRFIITWNRSDDPAKRCRVIVTGNPPTKPEGLWVVKYWGAWLDPTHPNPAKPGELRWYTTIDDRDVECPGPEPVMINGKQILPISRTFIPARLEDNPDLMTPAYEARLNATPEPLRSMLREGRFDVAIQDDPWQVIPTAWLLAAQARWTELPPKGIPMCAIGVDVARGGISNTTLAPRYDGWFAPLTVVPGVKTPLGTDVAGLVIANRRDQAMIVVDMGGGYGGAPLEHLRANLGVPAVVAYKGAEASVRRTSDKQLPFINKRSEAYWRFREALDPSQVHGSPISLPADPELIADLAAPRFEIGTRGIQITPKDKLTEDMGRSPDRGDAVVMSWFFGARGMTHGSIWRSEQGNGKSQFKVNLGPRRAQMRARR